MRVLYHLPLSPYARKVRLVLAEKRLPFELRLEKVWERRPEYLELNPAGTVPTLVEDSSLMGRTLAERIEIRRLASWFDGKFAAEVTQNLYGEKHLRRLTRRGNPDPAAIRTGYTALRYHLDYISWLAENRKWLAGSALSLADFAAAAHLSSLDFISEVDWSIAPAAKDWYARMKSRPSFRGVLADRVPGTTPPAHYADLDF
jgi:glutathione S-transferase